jgi:hypothetical protein
MKPATPSFKLLPALIVAIITAWFAHPAWAVSIEPTLTLTEVSNTQLTWAWDAAGGGTSGTITTLTPDNWGLTSISGPNLNLTPQGITGTNVWGEPERGFVNNAGTSYSQTNSTTFAWFIQAQSDLAFPFTVEPDGTVVDVAGNFKVAFFDKGDAALAPDTGTTASLFGLSLTGLAFLRRKLS